jgi:hypothetical protein
MATTGKGQSRSDFLRELFQKNPGVSEKEAAEAWAAAGNEGTISPTSFYTAKKASKGGSGATAAAPEKPKPKSSNGPKAKKTSRPVVEARPDSNGASAPSKPIGGSRSGDRERMLDRVEDGIDDLIIELKQLGGMEEALESLRRVRRVVVRSHEG